MDDVTESGVSRERECTFLNDLLRFAQYLDPDSNRAIRRAVAEYTHKVVNSEWRSLGESRKDKSAEQSFAILINTVVRSTPASPAEQVSYQRLVDIARKLGHRTSYELAARRLQTGAGAAIVLSTIMKYNSAEVVDSLVQIVAKESRALASMKKVAPYSAKSRRYIR
jgi:hypothetical protein